MGLEQVKSEILDEAREKADEIVEEAEVEAEEIVEEAETEAEKIEEKTEEEIEEQKESIRKKQLSNARMKARQRKLEARQRKLDTVFSRFRDRLESMGDQEKKSFLEKCVEKVDFEIGKVRTGEGFKKAVQENGFDPEEADINGIVVVSDDGERRVSFTMEKITEDFRERYRQEVSENLFQ